MNKLQSHGIAAKEHAAKDSEGGSWSKKRMWHRLRTILITTGLIGISMFIAIPSLRMIITDFASGHQSSANKTWEFILAIVPITIGALFFEIIGHAFRDKRQIYHSMIVLLPSIFALSLTFILICNYSGIEHKTMLMVRVIYMCFIFMITYSLMGRFAMAVWFLIFMAYSLNTFSVICYDTSLEPAALAEVLGATPDEFNKFVNAKSIFLFISFICLGAMTSYAIYRVMRKGEKRTIAIASFLFLVPALVNANILHVSHTFSIDNSITIKSLAKHIYKSYRLAKEQNNRLLSTVSNLESPAKEPSSISTLKGNEGVVLVFYLGESMRPDHMSIYGYERNTTPRLNQQKNLIKFCDCISVAPNTTGSFPAVLTNALGNIENPALQKGLMPTTGCVFDLFKANHFQVHTLLPMQGDVKNEIWGYKFMHLINHLFSHADSIRYLDEEMFIGQVSQVETILKSCERNENVAIFINNCGSHLPFRCYDKKHSPFQPASPEAYFQGPGNSKQIAEQAINAYDNTLYYTDSFIAELLKTLEGKPYIFICVGDHGENLGETGSWMRLTGHPELYYSHSTCKVPLFIIPSDEFLSLNEHFKTRASQLQKNSAVSASHGNIFHTLLGIFGIQTPYYDERLDLSSPNVQPYQGPHPSRGGQSIDGRRWY